MAALSETEKQNIAAKWAEILSTSAPLGAREAAFAADFDPRGEFCGDWPTAKEVLEALKTVLPQPGPIIVSLVIAAGDAASAKICPAKG